MFEVRVNILWPPCNHLFHSCFQCIQARNHSDNLQQDQHMWLRSYTEQVHIRRYLRILEKNHWNVLSITCI